MPYQDILVGDLLGAIDRHEIEPLMGSGTGQGIAWATRETTVAEVMAAFVSEAAEVLSRLRRVGATAGAPA